MRFPAEPLTRSLPAPGSVPNTFQSSASRTGSMARGFPSDKSLGYYRLSAARTNPERGTIKMQRRLSDSLLIAILFLFPLSTWAQDPELLRHFDYDQKTPLNIKRIGVVHHEHADVYDITYDS